MNKIIKILMLNYEYPPLGGGSANANFYLLKEFSKLKNIKVDLVTSSINKFCVRKISENISIHFLDIGKNKSNLHYQNNKDLLKYSWKSYHYSKKLIIKNKYDLTHAFFGIPSGYIAMKFKLPYIVSLRGSDVPFHNPRFEKMDKLFLQRLSRKIWKKARTVVVNSEGLKEEAENTEKSIDYKIIYNGVDTKKFSPSVKSTGKDKIVIISTGRLNRVKGYEYLIKALAGLKNCKLKLIGDGNIKNELKDLAKNEKVDLELPGKIPHSEIPAHLKDANIFVLSSLNEGMSNSLLEAMASGLAVIATDVGGSKELIKNNGFIVKKASSESLGEAVNKYLLNRSLLSKHGKVSRNIALKMNWKNMANEYIKVYEKCLK